MVKMVKIIFLTKLPIVDFDFAHIYVIHAVLKKMKNY